jgi:hypothetical protein
MHAIAKNYGETAFQEERDKVTQQFIARLGNQLESILFYPHIFPRVDYEHPFAYCGFLLVFRDHLDSMVESIGIAYDCVPTDTPLYCLRRRELFELSLPGFWFLGVVDHQMHLPYFLKYKGEVLYGRDLRDEIHLPANPRLLFHNKLEVCAHFLRSGVILELLVQGEYSVLVKKLERQIKCVMAAALLAHGEWDVTLDDIPERFNRRYRNEEVIRIWHEYRLLWEGNVSAHEDGARQTALEAVWLFESFLRQLWSELERSPASI